MLHRYSCTSPWDQVCSLIYILLECVFWTSHVVVLGTFWNWSSFLDGCIKFSWKPVPVSFLQVKTSSVVGCGTIIGFTVTHIRRCCVGGLGSRTDFSHISEMVEDTKMRSGLYPFFHIALLNDFGRFALCMSDRLFEYAHYSTDSTSLFVAVYPQSVLWLFNTTNQYIPVMPQLLKSDYFSSTTVDTSENNNINYNNVLPFYLTSDDELDIFL